MEYRGERSERPTLSAPTGPELFFEYEFCEKMFKYGGLKNKQPTSVKVTLRFFSFLSFICDRSGYLKL